MATKEQELKALQQIRKIVSGLGDDSYIATAFEGCFEIAEENIQNDWACSMKQRAESAEHKLEVSEERINNLKARIDNLDRMYQSTIAEQEQKIKQLKKCRLSPDDLECFRQLASAAEHEAEQAEKQSAEIIVHYADTPTDIAFQAAVKSNRAAANKRKAWAELRDRIETINNRG